MVGGKAEVCSGRRPFRGLKGAEKIQVHRPFDSHAPRGPELQRAAREVGSPPDEARAGPVQKSLVGARRGPGDAAVHGVDVTAHRIARRHHEPLSPEVAGQDERNPRGNPCGF